MWVPIPVPFTTSVVSRCSVPGLSFTICKVGESILASSVDAARVLKNHTQ